MKPTAEQLSFCLAQVTRFIPSPAKPQAREQASKWGLKVGQLLGTPSGEVFKVVEVDSLGITLETPDMKVCRVETKDEAVRYEKKKAPRKSRTKASLLDSPT